MEDQISSAEASVDGGFVAQFAHDMTESTIYLMGGSFILGSLVTVVLLLILDFMRRGSSE